MTHVAQEVAEFICTTSFDDFPKEVVEKAKLCLIDSIGVALYGSRFDAAQIVLSLAKEIGGKEESTILGSTVKVPLHG
jgi:2-methylcitrate dehydratase PrpD